MKITALAFSINVKIKYANVNYAKSFYLAASNGDQE
jgi:hypothetical protein